MWTVGIIESCEFLAAFLSHDEAAKFISTLPDHADGIYYLDGPCRDYISAKGMTMSLHESGVI